MLPLVTEFFLSLPEFSLSLPEFSRFLKFFGGCDAPDGGDTLASPKYSHFTVAQPVVLSQI